ncbi:MAG TPA: ATP-binding protein [Candidatus Limnocylindrales bacterium]|nr:ATP-binding protein [Candidatus Limnocylindrales bacterium]
MLHLLPIRLRIALASAVSMAVVLLIAGLIVYQRMSSELDASIDRSLRARAGDIGALVQQADTGLRDAAAVAQPPADTRTSAAQIVTPAGRVLDATPPFTRTSLIGGALLARATSGSVLTTIAVRGENPPMRILATPIVAQDQQLVVVVAASVEQRDEALAKLLSQLMLVAPFGLLLAGASGWAIATGALRPVDEIRRAADTISRAQLDQRIPRGPRRDELGSLTDTLNAMLDRLADSARREQRFIADAAHELRSPLATLRAELELSRRRPRDRRALERVLDSALGETERLCRLADDLLLLARAERGVLELQTESVVVPELLETVARRFAAAAALSGRAVRTADTPVSAVVRADRLRLEQAVGNLVDNALRHGLGDVTLSAGMDGATIAIRIADEGPGIPDSIAASAFRPFTRGPGAGARTGSGLGLAITSEIARAHGGRITSRRHAAGFAVDIAIPTEPSRSSASR